MSARQTRFLDFMLKVLTKVCSQLAIQCLRWIIDILF